MNETHDFEAREALVDARREGERLDRALELLVPGSGLRLRRRLIEAGRVLLDGRPATPGRRVRQGQRLELLPGVVEEEAQELAIAARTAGYAAVVKPVGLHSAAICGSSAPSVEALLPGLFPEARPMLLNRLDRETSGLVLVALSPEKQRHYAQLDPRRIVKEYTAVVHGELDQELTLKFVLDTDDRKRTRVVARLNPDETGWTRVWPVEKLPGGPADRPLDDLTLVRVRIVSGARHQIRAHLAFAGLPILGDPLYGVGDDGAPRMYLHHGLLEFPGFRAQAQPDWPKLDWPKSDRSDPSLNKDKPGPAPDERSEEPQ